MKKLICLLLAFSMMISFAACKKNGSGDDSETTSVSGSETAGESESGGSEEPTEVVEITIPTVTADLSAPENKVAVSANEKSEVFDKNGRKLTDEEWLLNSKFSKAYIKSLGMGEYEFSYRSKTKKGTIKLVITDDNKPNYVFDFDLAASFNYLERVNLPKLVKEQDSYQEDYTPVYTLEKDGGKVELDGFLTPKLEAGSYVWKAVIEKGGKTFEYVGNFVVKTFEEWLSEIRDTMLFDNQTGEYIKSVDGKYPIDTTNNAGMFSYTVDNSILQSAMTAGKTQVKVEVLSDVIINADQGNGDLWLSNGWNGYVWAFSDSKEYFEDKSNDLPPRISGMTKVGDKFNYYTTGYLRNAYFSASSKNPLQLDFANGAKAKTVVTVTFYEG